MTTNRVYHEDGSAAPVDRIFVFGSNLSGFHGAGAAFAAYKYYGATPGIGEGPMGNAFAIPTKDEWVKNTLPLDVIISYVAKFVKYTQDNPTKKFFVTRVGCGLAGLKNHDIAPLFAEAINCSFAKEWKPFLENNK